MKTKLYKKALQLIKDNVIYKTIEQLTPDNTYYTFFNKMSKTEKELFVYYVAVRAILYIDYYKYRRKYKHRTPIRLNSDSLFEPSIDIFELFQQINALKIMNDSATTLKEFLNKFNNEKHI